MSAQLPSFVRELKGIIGLDLIFETITGLLVRMPVQAQAYRIGGADQYPMVTRRRYDDREIDVPYVPGSSLKGRVRSLLEVALGQKLYTSDGKVWQHVRSLTTMEKEFFDDVEKRCIVDELFGWAAANYKQISDAIKELKLSGTNADDVFKNLAPTRLLVSDFFPTEDYVRNIDARSVADFLEEKSENRIDRITSAADPRNVVRVKLGIEFGGGMKILVFDLDRDNVSKYLYTVGSGLKLVEETYLGGSGSRGYGRVKFTKIRLNVLKTEKSDVPKLVDTNIKKEYKSVNEFLSEIDQLAKSIVDVLFS